jgi:uncharacterized HAD superfamily protein
MIFCDLDGVLCNFDKAFIAEIVGKFGPMDVSGRTDWKWSSVFTNKQYKFGWKQTEAMAWWESLEALAPQIVFERLALFHRDLPVVFITCRKYYAREQTLNWLEARGIANPELVFCDDKGLVARSFEPYAAVEDSPKQALLLAEAGVEVALVDYPYNRDVSHPLITRCATILDAFDLVGLPDLPDTEQPCYICGCTNGHIECPEDPSSITEY